MDTLTTKTTLTPEAARRFLQQIAAQQPVTDKIPFVLSDSTNALLDNYCQEPDLFQDAVDRLMQTRQGVIEALNWMRASEFRIDTNKLQVKYFQSVNATYKATIDLLRESLLNALDRYHSGKLVISDEFAVTPYFKPEDECLTITDDALLPDSVKLFSCTVTMPAKHESSFLAALEAIKQTEPANVRAFKITAKKKTVNQELVIGQLKQMEKPIMEGCTFDPQKRGVQIKYPDLVEMTGGVESLEGGKP